MSREFFEGESMTLMVSPDHNNAHGVIIDNLLETNHFHLILILRVIEAANAVGLTATL